MSEAGGLKIVSDGTATGTHVLDADGQMLRLGKTCGIKRVVIDPIEPGGHVTAHLTLEGVGLDIIATPRVKQRRKHQP
jgi:hypothetical protein